MRQHGIPYLLSQGVRRDKSARREPCRANNPAARLTLSLPPLAANPTHDNPVTRESETKP
jgi:hypothetical protein